MQVTFETSQEDIQRTTTLPTNYILNIEAKGNIQKIDWYKNLILNLDKIYRKEVL
jgi:hypothetical protein